MRYMILVKATKDSEAGVMPPEELLTAMADYHEQLAKAGVLLDGNGLQPSSKGWRIKYSGDKRTVIDGPFTETEGTRRRLHDHSSEVQAGGVGVGEAFSQSSPRGGRDRSQADVRAGRFRRERND